MPPFSIRISDNVIFSNGGLGIDLEEDGVTPNDPLDTDSGANLRQNFPRLHSSAPAVVATQKGVVVPTPTLAITGTFNSTPNSTFTLQFFFGTQKDASGHQLSGSIPVVLTPTKTVTTDSNGNAPFTYTFEFPSGYHSGFVNATATSMDGNTSEQTKCISVTNPTLLVITSVEKSGKNFVVTGDGFVEGAKLLVNGEVKKTRVDSATSIFGKKAAKAVQLPAKLQVRNPSGSLSNEWTYP